MQSHEPAALIAENCHSSASSEILTPELRAIIEAAARAACRAIADSWPSSGDFELCDQQLGYSIASLAKVTTLGRQSIYHAINARQLVARKDGRRTLILKSDALCWLRNLPAIDPALPGDNLDPTSSEMAGGSGQTTTWGKTRPGKTRSVQNATPPSPPLSEPRDSRFRGQERSQQNPKFLARRHGKGGKPTCDLPAAGADMALQHAPVGASGEVL